MSNYIHGQTIEELREEYQKLLRENPQQTKLQIQGIMIGKYGIKHDEQGRVIPVSLEKVFTDDSSDESGSN